MKEGWILVYTTLEEYQARIADDILKQNGIESHVVNKPDSVLPSLGEAELYVPAEKAEQALAVLKTNNILEE